MASFQIIKKGGIKKLPKSPGVYAFKKGAKLLYIGKASNIKERVKNHFLQPAYRNNLFIDQVKKIGFIKTDSEIEALILEANLIKKYQPKYNVIWRDDKNYFFVGITKEDFPRIFITHQPKPYNLFSHGFLSCKEKFRYLGPFVDGKALKQTLKILRKIFPYRSCNKIPKHPCLWYQLKRCPAPCLLKSDKSSLLRSNELFAQLEKDLKEISQRNAKNLIKILQGKKNQVLRDLKKEMKKASVFQDFEKAAKIRDQILALEKVLNHAKIFSLEEKLINSARANYCLWKEVEKKLKKLIKTKNKISRIEAYDVSNIQGQEATGSMITFIDGKPDKNFYRRFKIKIAGKPNDLAMLREILTRRFQHPEWSWPDLILIDGGKAQLKAALHCSRFYLEKIKVVALAKRKNQLFIESQKKPILLKKLPREIFNLILQLRDEAHRFALSYHQKLREKELRP